MALSFELTEQQLHVRRVAREFAVERVAPRARAMNASGEFPTDLVREMGTLGLFGLPFPSHLGGSDGDLLSLCLAIEEIGRVDQSLGVTLEAGVGLGSKPIYRFGTEGQRQRWLPPLARGEELAGFALTEPGGGSDAGSLQTRARPDGDGWRINGAKQFITNAGTELSSLVTVTAVTGEGDDSREFTSFIVPTGTPGYRIGPGYHKVGWHASDTRDLHFDDAWVPAENKLGETGRGLANSLAALEEGRIALAALATGLIQGCIDECVRYAKSRSAFGKPLGGHQAVAFKVADMEVAAQVARNAYLRAAWLAEHGRPVAKEAATAKLVASEAAVRTAREACQVFGGYGFLTDNPVGRFYQDAKVLEIGEGTSEMQRMIIARQLGLGP